MSDIGSRRSRFDRQEGSRVGYPVLSSWLRAVIRLLVVVWTLSDTAASADVLDLGLIIGNNDYEGDVAGRRRLRYADDDALRAARVFRTLYPSASFWLLIDPDEETRNAIDKTGATEGLPNLETWVRTISGIRAVVHEARRQGIDAVRLFIYFSGHGENHGFLHLADHRLSRAEFHQAVAQIGADQVSALMDGCYLGSAMRSGRMGPSSRAASIFSDELLLPPERPASLGLIGATTEVQEHESLQGGLLTAIGLGGLAGLADLDNNRRLDFEEWARFVQAQAGTKTSPIGVVWRGPERDPLRVIVDYDKLNLGGIEFIRDFPAGHVQIRSVIGERLLYEFHHTAGSDRRIYLRPATYRVVRILHHAALGRVYPERWTSVEVIGAMVRLDRNTPMRQRIAEVRGSRGTHSASSDDRLLESEEERYLVTSPLRTPPLPIRRLYRPWLTTTALLIPAAWDLPVCLADGGRSPLSGVTSGVGWDLSVSRGQLLSRRGRWMLSAGGVLGLTSIPHATLSCGAETHIPARRHEMRIGLEAGLSRTGVSWVTDASFRLSAGPTILLASGHALDRHHWREQAKDGLGAYLAGLEAHIALRRSLAGNWQWGPVISGRVFVGTHSLLGTLATEPVAWGMLLFGAQLERGPLRSHPVH